MTVKFSKTEYKKLRVILPVYKQAQQAFFDKYKNLKKELAKFHNGNPIEHIKGRLKSPESIAQKLHKLNLEITAENAGKFIKDISGIRIICPFSKYIHGLVDAVSSVQGWVVTDKKDYISAPKPGGYRSFHMIVEIPVHHSGKTETIPVEVQIRTAAMDFWAAIEHKVRYKYKEHVPQHLSDELVICANKIAELDERMLLIYEIVTLINDEPRPEERAYFKTGIKPF